MKRILAILTFLTAWALAAQAQDSYGENPGYCPRDSWPYLYERFQPGAVGKIFERGPRHRVEPRVGQHFFKLGEFRHVAGLQSLKRGLGLRVQFVLRLRRRGKAKRENGNQAKKEGTFHD